MPIYELINPSDEYTLEGEETIAIVTCWLLGSGQYGLRNRDTGEVVSGVLFPTQKRIDEVLPGGIVPFIESHVEALAPCLRSLVIGDRTAYDLALAHITDESEREKFKLEWLDKHRSSMNDIGSRAIAQAEFIWSKRSSPNFWRQ